MKKYFDQAVLWSNSTLIKQYFEAVESSSRFNYQQNLAADSTIITTIESRDSVTKWVYTPYLQTHYQVWINPSSALNFPTILPKFSSLPLHGKIKHKTKHMHKWKYLEDWILILVHYTFKYSRIRVFQRIEPFNPFEYLKINTHTFSNTKINLTLYKPCVHIQFINVVKAKIQSFLKRQNFNIYIGGSSLFMLLLNTFSKKLTIKK
jgi:hypothetical protein